jgi:hypothetical protein
MYFGMNERHRGELIMQFCFFLINMNVRACFKINNYITF